MNVKIGFKNMLFQYSTFSMFLFKTEKNFMLDKELILFSNAKF